MSKEKYNIMAMDVDMRFQSFEKLPLGEALDGDKFSFPGVKILITSRYEDPTFQDGTLLYVYCAKVTK